MVQLKLKLTLTDNMPQQPIANKTLNRVPGAAVFVNGNGLTPGLHRTVRDGIDVPTAANENYQVLLAFGREAHVLVSSEQYLDQIAARFGQEFHPEPSV